MEQRAESINPDGRRRRSGAGPSEEIGCISGVRGTSRLVCRRPRTRRDPRENSGGSRHRWESPLCPGVQVHVRRGRARTAGKRWERESRETGVAESPERCAIMASRVTRARDDASGTRTSSQRERGDGERGRSASLGGDSPDNSSIPPSCSRTLNKRSSTHSLTTAAASHPSFVRVDRPDGTRGPWRGLIPRSRNYTAMRA